MRNILNLIITLVVFWVGNEYFKEYISFVDTETLIISAIMMFVIGIIYSVVTLISVFLIPIGVGCLTIVPLMIGTIFLTPIKLWLLDTYVSGVEINGFWTYVIVTVVLSIFTINLNAKTQKE